MIGRQFCVYDDPEPVDPSREWTCDACDGPFDDGKATGVMIERFLRGNAEQRRCVKLCARCAAAVSVAQILTIHERWECEHGISAGDPCSKCEAMWPAMVRQCLNVEGQE